MVSGTPVVLAAPSLAPTIVPVTILAATPVVVTATPGPSVTASPTVVCPPQPGWWPYTARQGDTLGSIAKAFGADAYLLIQGNCLLNTDITAGQTLYIPPIPTRAPVSTRGPAPAPTFCGPPLTWVNYFVQPGDTLYGLALRHRMSVSAARASCLTSYALRVVSHSPFRAGYPSDGNTCAAFGHSTARLHTPALGDRSA
jgi:LysM repeat protein